jgi:hypothetical protein
MPTFRERRQDFVYDLAIDRVAPSPQLLRSTHRSDATPRAAACGSPFILRSAPKFGLVPSWYDGLPARHRNRFHQARRPAVRSGTL